MGVEGLFEKDQSDLNGDGKTKGTVTGVRTSNFVAVSRSSSTPCCRSIAVILDDSEPRSLRLTWQ